MIKACRHDKNTMNMFHKRGILSARRRGFTLIELLVVIAIISLLVSILVPSLQKAKELAKSLTCLSNTRNLLLAQAQYSSDTGVVGHYFNNGSFSVPWFYWLRNTEYLTAYQAGSWQWS